MAKHCYRINYGFDNFRVVKLHCGYVIQYKGFLSSRGWKDCGAILISDRRKAKKELNRLAKSR